MTKTSIKLEKLNKKIEVKLARTPEPFHEFIKNNYEKIKHKCRFNEIKKMSILEDEQE